MRNIFRQKAPAADPISEIREMLVYQATLLEEILEQLDMRERTAEKARMDLEQHKRRISEMLKGMPGISGNPQYQDMISNIFSTLGGGK